MKKYIFGLLTGLSIIGSVAYASTIPVTPAFYETYLASAEATGDTSLSVASTARTREASGAR